MSALEQFTYNGAEIRTFIIDGAPWFIARDVATVLEIQNVRQVIGSFDSDDVSTAYATDPLGRQQPYATVSEAGLYELIFQSRKPEAKAFRRWVTHEVLPTIRRSGSYAATPVVELSRMEILTLALESETRAIAAEAKVAELAPAADAWAELAGAAGDYEVADAAKILARAGVETGRQRLFDQLARLGWIHRGASGKWKAYQTAVDAGYLTEKPMSHHHPRTGEIVLDPPQVRVTVRGLDRLRVRLGTLDLAVAS